jgi:CBS domain-containing protein
MGMPISLSIEDFMIRGIITISVEASIIDAINKMVKYSIGCLIVKRGNEFTGIITERDILKRCSKENIYAPDLTVGKIMSFPLITVEAEAPIGKATQLMEEKSIRRLLVEKDRQIIGIITQKDVLRETLKIFKALHSI